MRVIESFLDEFEDFLACMVERPDLRSFDGEVFYKEDIDLLSDCVFSTTVLLVRSGEPL